MAVYIYTCHTPREVTCDSLTNKTKNSYHTMLRSSILRLAVFAAVFLQGMFGFPTLPFFSIIFADFTNFSMQRLPNCAMSWSFSSVPYVPNNWHIFEVFFELRYSRSCSSLWLPCGGDLFVPSFLVCNAHAKILAAQVKKRIVWSVDSGVSKYGF